ncbi:phzS [Symbiodinium sp. CCMP2592]|nr:phzS [Symbiodinium sp. CCMP2592]
MFRGVTTSAPFLDGETMILSGNSQLKLVIYPIQWSESSSALQLINWVAEVDGLSDAGEINYGAKIDDAEQVLKHFVRFDLPFLNHAQLIKSTRHIFVWPMVDCDPLASWVQGRVALLGDAAHPMYPIGSNGGSTAIQDAAAIAELLSTAGSDGPGIEAALVEYQQQRLPVVSDVQHACRLMLPEKVMDEVEHRVARGTTIPARYGENLQIALRLAQKGRT